MPPEVARWIGIWLPFLQAAEAGLWLFWITETEIIAVPRPSLLIEGDRLHCATGPAVHWPDGARYWFWRGVQVPELVIERPASITVAMVDGEANAEMRRVMIERFGGGRDLGGGPEAYIRASGAQRLDHDEHFGTLYRRAFEDDEPLVMVEVVNRSPEPDGSFKHYWLRVPPDMTSAREAVAWSFGKTRASAYRPRIET
jgi:hypothetical protein